MRHELGIRWSDTEHSTEWRVEAAWRSRLQGHTIAVMKAQLASGSPFIHEKVGALRMLLTYLLLDNIHFTN